MEVNKTENLYSLEKDKVILWNEKFWKVTRKFAKPKSDLIIPTSNSEEKQLFVIMQVVLSWRKKIPNNSWKLYFSEKMAFLWIEGKGVSNIWSTFPLITLICLKLRRKPLGKVYWPSQWQKSFQFILNLLHGPPPSLPDIGPMISKPWIEKQLKMREEPRSPWHSFFAPCLQRWCKGKDLKIFQKQGGFQRASEWVFFEGLPSLRKTSQN